MENYKKTPLTSEYNGKTLYFGFKGWTANGADFYKTEDELIATL